MPPTKRRRATDVRRRALAAGAACLAALLGSAGSSSGAAPAASPAVPSDPTYAALRSARPDGPTFAVTGWTLERDAFRFRFASGRFQFLTPVGGRTIGAVFVGDGSVDLLPAVESERRHLAFRTGDPKLEVLSDTFRSLVLIFTDATAEEIAAHGAPSPTPPDGAAAVYEKFLKKQRKDLQNNVFIRPLEDLVEGTPPENGFFLGYFDGKALPPAFVLVDPTTLAHWFSPSEVGGVGAALYVRDADKGGYWYLAHTKADLESGRLSDERSRADALGYTIDTTIQKNARIQATTTVRFEPRVDGLRVLPVALMAKLRVKDAAFGLGEDGPWSPLPFVQEDEDEDGDLAVIFPEPLPAGRVARLRLTYEGKDVLLDAGDGNFLVGARDSWYPNLGTGSDLASFDLTYRCPKAYQVVSVGLLLQERVEGDERISVWKADHPIRVAGFNYGKFRRIERSDAESGMTVDVYTNPGEPDFLRQINFALENRPDAGLRHVSASATLLAEAAMTDGINTARVAATYFGKLPEATVSITQQTQAFFGQSWPSLVYLPYVAAFDPTIRHELGLQNTGDFVDLVGPHELAHQWWGHRVGWSTYRDQWLSEGFAEFTAALVLQYTAGLGKANAFWERARRWIVLKPRNASVANDEAGPISDGWRLSTWRNRSAAQAMIYSKGAYVVHMLRMMMRDPEAPEQDTKFIAMLRDFVETEADKNPTTADFQAVVERHMTPEMNLAGDGRMDWFFREWVDGTEIPRFLQKLSVAAEGDGTYRIRGTVAQDGVSEGFRCLVAIYAETKGEVKRVALVPLAGPSPAPVDVTVPLAKPPDRLIVNALHDVLSRD